MSKFVIFVISLVILLITITIYSLVQETKYMEEHHCVNIGEPQSNYVIQYIFNAKGNIQSTYPIEITSYMYQCDNGKIRR